MILIDRTRILEWIRSLHYKKKELHWYKIVRWRYKETIITRSGMIHLYQVYDPTGYNMEWAIPHKNGKDKKETFEEYYDQIEKHLGTTRKKEVIWSHR